MGEATRQKVINSLSFLGVERPFRPAQQRFGRQAQGGPDQQPQLQGRLVNSAVAQPGADCGNGLADAGQPVHTDSAIRLA